MSPQSSNPPVSATTQASVATQTDINPPTSNVGQGQDPIDKSKHAHLFEFEIKVYVLIYLLGLGLGQFRNLARVVGKEFLAEATLKDKNLQAIIKFVKAHK